MRVRAQQDTQGTTVARDTQTPGRTETLPRPPDGDGRATLAEIPSPPESANGHPEPEEPERRPTRRRTGRPTWQWVALLVAVGVGIVLFLRWRAAQPVPVVVVHP